MSDRVDIGPVLGERFDDALVFAARTHRAQRRKGSGIPYVGHLLGVCSLVIEDGGSEDEAIAALLHDAAEDQGGEAMLTQIRSRFGDPVADIVAACSDTFETPKPPWRQRKEQYVRHLATAPERVRRVSLADKLFNARAILRDYLTVGDELWSRFSPQSGGAAGQLWYYRQLADQFVALQPGPMAREFDETVTELERLQTAADSAPTPVTEDEPAQQTIDLADACTVWQSGRDGGSSALRGGARVVTAIPHYFDASYIRDNTRAGADPDIQARACLLLDAIAAAPLRTPRDWYETCGLDGEPFAGRGIARKDSQDEDRQILESLKQGWLQMPLWGFSLNQQVAEDYGRASEGLMSFMFELTGPSQGIAAWQSSDIKADQLEIIASGVYAVTDLKQRDSTWWVQLNQIGRVWPVSGVEASP